jgi:hypothetical protein
MDWGQIARAVGGAAKVAMESAPEAGGRTKSAEELRQDHKRKLDQEIADAQHETELRREKALQEGYNEYLGGTEESVGILASDINDRSVMQGVNFSSIYPQAVIDVQNYAAGQNRNAQAVGAVRGGITPAQQRGAMSPPPAAGYN